MTITTIETLSKKATTSMKLEEFKIQFDDLLQEYIDQKIQAVRPYFPDENSYSLLTYLKKYIQGGKRFRPYMVYLGYTMYGGDDIDLSMRVGMIHELIHIFALIHDDICDQGETRHHILTYHRHIAALYDDDHVGTAQAIIIGDLVYTRAVQLISEVIITHPQAVGYIHTMLEQVTVGQLLDIHFSYTNTSFPLEVIHQKDHLKSGQYTIQHPLVVGASIAGADDNDIETLLSLGKVMGIAFQVRDDLLDRLPNKEGKTSMSDLQEGNQTTVINILLQAGDQSEKEMIKNIMGKPLTQDDRVTLNELFTYYQIKEKVLTIIDGQLTKAISTVSQLTAKNEYTKNLYDMIEVLRKV